MQSYLAVLALLLIVIMVLTRVQAARGDRKAVHFGKLDKKDFLIPPFAAFYFYLIVAHAFDFPSLSGQEFFHSRVISWIGVLCCAVGVILMVWSLVSFGSSFRIGIDTDQPDALVTTGVFAISRNPIYLAFATVVIGQFLVFPNWILLVYLAAAFGLFHRQVLREESFLKEHYGSEYIEYCRKVRRYL